jgi:hypothetical protein
VIAHVILFTPRADLPASTRADLLHGLAAAAAQIPSVRRFRVGRRATHGLPGYEQAMPITYSFAAIVEFDDMGGLKDYLTHPAHLAIGEHFTASASSALAFDYEMFDAADAAQLLA